MPLPFILSLLPTLNTLLPQLLAAYRTVRDVARADDPTVAALSDVELINLLAVDADALVARADALLAKYR